MYSHQKSIFSGFVWLLGCYSILAPVYGIVVLPDIIFEAKKQPDLLMMVSFVFRFLANWLLFFGFGVYVSSFCFKLFPSLKITTEGIHSKYMFGIRKDFFKWDEIQKITTRGNYTFLILHRPGLNLLNGLHINALHGKMFGIMRPVLILSPYLENRDEITAKIRKETNIFD
ncbi:MAG: hypothetical protein CVU44_09335 [Chloroflexi bacterium HGW-Chloroflexi-6]|nr:MAG: hypothetical protein CVU44_09335 [Chloroflexi bacterium HGW-Chloroflexi-6]